MKQLFIKDLEKIYFLLEERQNSLNNYYNIVKNREKSSQDEIEFCDNFLKNISLEINKESRLAVVNRLVSLREDSLVQELKKRDFSDNEIDIIMEKSYIWVKEFYLKEHKKLLHKINSLRLLTPFYRTLLDGIHEIGKALSVWQIKWHKHIINGINKELYELFDGDEDKILHFLSKENLFETDEDGKRADRSYSVLKKEGDRYISLTYKKAFPNEVEKVVKELGMLKLKLSVLDDEIYNQKEAYLDYFQKLIEAFNEENSKNLIKKWADVDRAWMKITTPLQIGHPLEYYEDHYRKAVALEWDVRLQSTKQTNSTKTKTEIKDMFLSLYNSLTNSEDKYNPIKLSTLSNLDKTQLYIGRPMLFYAAEFNGLFSAQVVPNDEKVSSEMGKKIFAFSDNILEAQKAKPRLKLHQMVFGDQFLDIEKDIMFSEPDIWHEIYDITTIGHEFGHILWMDRDSETVMNKTGNFKNIEEFKATTGGLNAFFTHPKEELKEYILRDIVKRAITLIAWMQTGEVEPYYCEGLIHLDILFKSEVLYFDGKLDIDISKDSFNKVSKNYSDTYKKLALHYLNKEDATLFLNKFAEKKGKYFLPSDEKVKKFVEYYWTLHKNIGREIAN